MVILKLNTYEWYFLRYQWNVWEEKYKKTYAFKIINLFLYIFFEIYIDPSLCSQLIYSSLYYAYALWIFLYLIRLQYNKILATKKNLFFINFNQIIVNKVKKLFQINLLNLTHHIINCFEDRQRLLALIRRGGLSRSNFQGLLQGLHLEVKVPEMPSVDWEPKRGYNYCEVISSIHVFFLLLLLSNKWREKEKILSLHLCLKFRLCFIIFTFIYLVL